MCGGDNYDGFVRKSRLLLEIILTFAGFCFHCKVFFTNYISFCQTLVQCEYALLFIQLLV